MALCEKWFIQEVGALQIGILKLDKAVSSVMWKD
jgi:hypothetical protein